MYTDKRLPIHKLVYCEMIGAGNAASDFQNDHREILIGQALLPMENEVQILEAVSGCDGAIIFSLNGLDPLSARVNNKFLSCNKTVLLVDLDTFTSTRAVDRMVDWIRRNGVLTLLVFGSSVPGAYGSVKLILEMWAQRYLGKP